LVADTCLYGLGVELIAAVALTRYLDSTDAAFYAQCGEIGSGEPLLTLALVLCFDELTGIFLAILTLALLICFLFLAEYFEYDSGASAITLLSALFSQTALLYFCAFDLLLLIFC
jgi:formate hydrogenlyase subunit 3/multisubunit Na+/H+ antiporter MnhD subunit